MFMPSTKLKCPKCGSQILRRLLRKTRGKCVKCGFLVATYLTKFSTARSRIRSKYSSR